MHLSNGFEKFNASENLFKQENSIKQGKYVIVEAYRQISLLANEIKNIFIIT